MNSNYRVGFAPGAIPGNCYGLTGMAERAELGGAEFMVESVLGEGTRVWVEIGGATQ